MWEFAQWWNRRAFTYLTITIPKKSWTMIDLCSQIGKKNEDGIGLELIVTRSAGEVGRNYPRSTTEQLNSFMHLNMFSWCNNHREKSFWVTVIHNNDCFLLNFSPAKQKNPSNPIRSTVSFKWELSSWLSQDQRGDTYHNILYIHLHSIQNLFGILN